MTWTVQPANIETSPSGEQKQKPLKTLRLREGKQTFTKIRTWVTLFVFKFHEILQTNSGFCFAVIESRQFVNADKVKLFEWNFPMSPILLCCSIFRRNGNWISNQCCCFSSCNVFLWIMGLWPRHRPSYREISLNFNQFWPLLIWTFS